jgi:ectoine hydroxylase-related dioxygenase (phytanoyl-CoA dioxygenase family)
VANAARWHVDGDLARDGAVCVRGAFDAEQIDLARRAIDAVLADPSPLALRASDPDDGAFVEDFRNWTRIPELGEFATASAAAPLAGALLGGATVRLHHDHVLVKEPGTRQRTPWHQDQPYYDLDGRMNVSMWIPVDPVPIDGTLEFVAGSHLGPWYLPRTFRDGHAKWFPEGSLSDLPDIDGDPGAHRILRWALEPGDCVCFHMLTLHSAPGFRGPGRRRVLSLRFVGDDITHAPRPWVTSPPFPELLGVLAAGSPLDHPLFPIVWQRGSDVGS